MPGYQVKLQNVSIGDYNYRIRSLKDRQQYADPEGEAAAAGIFSGTWSLFGTLWPAAIVLARLMHEHAIENLRILEVGCGLGLASLVAHRRGADITASDHHPLARQFLSANTALNHFPPLRFESCDWAEESPGLGTFDLIIGSDLLYEPDHPQLLSAFIDRHAAADAKVILIDPDRGQRSRFNRQMVALGFAVDTVLLAGAPNDPLHFKGKILTYQRQLAADAAARPQRETH